MWVFWHGELIYNSGGIFHDDDDDDVRDDVSILLILSFFSQLVFRQNLAKRSGKDVDGRGKSPRHVFDPEL